MTTGGPALTGEATINVLVTDINDHAPTFDLPRLSASIVEGQGEGLNIIQVTASDADSGLNAKIRYSMSNNSDAKSFHIDPVTGSLTLYHVSTSYHVSVQMSMTLITDLGWITNAIALDREVKDKYQLTVYASDLGSISRTSSANVQVLYS